MQCAEGENLPKDSLACLTLYPDTAIEHARSACALLAKSLRLIQGLGLSEREVLYLLTHSANFDNLDLGSLPTGPAEGSQDQANSLFNQFLRLAEYARLKRTLAAGSDDLVGIFEANPLDVKYLRIAEVTRREEQTVRATAEQLGLVSRDLDQEQGLWRLWNALQIVARLGVPVQDMAAVTGIVGGGTPPGRAVRCNGKGCLTS